MSVRESILSRIRNHTRRNGFSAEDIMAHRKTIAIPKPEFDYDPDRVALFTRRLGNVHGTITKVRQLAEIPIAVKAYLSDIEALGECVVSPCQVFEDMNWIDLKIRLGKAEKQDQISVTMAFAGIAETGTIVMVSGPESPVTSNFLPEINIAVLFQSGLLGSMEELWLRLDRQPRALNFITGPSKTADIEQTIVYGAHGPRYFHVVLVGE